MEPPPSSLLLTLPLTAWMSAVLFSASTSTLMSSTGTIDALKNLMGSISQRNMFGPSWWEERRRRKGHLRHANDRKHVRLVTCTG